jgi:excisionase family DNA binding protein
MDTLWTVQDVARVLNVPVSWVYARAEDGSVPSVKVGRYRRFEPAAIQAWVERQRTKSVGGAR